MSDVTNKLSSFEAITSAEDVDLRTEILSAHGSDLVAATLDIEEHINNIRLREGQDYDAAASVKLHEEKGLSLGQEVEKGPNVTQEIVVKPVKEILASNATNTSNSNGNSNSNLSKTSSGSLFFERRARPQKEAAVKCPKCNSTNTKFSYYNNYSLSQPRYLCKTCKKYWTAVQTLGNIPVGGGSRKNKSSSYSSEAKTTLNNVSEVLQLHNFDAKRNTNASVSTTTITNNTASALELLTGVTSTKTSATHDDAPHVGKNKHENCDSNEF